MSRARITADNREAFCIDAEIARLRGLDNKALRVRWRTAFRRDAAPHIPRHLLFATLAYHLQAEVLGDLDAETVRFVRQIGSTSSKEAAVPLTKAFERRKRRLSPGTVLTRDWGGQHHRVMVLEGGFAWAGRTYNSLSEIARAITGTKWNGPRFFGLREKKSAEPTE